MSLSEEKAALQARRKQALADTRAAALKANLKKRKEQINARSNSNEKNEKQDEKI